MPNRSPPPRRQRGELPIARVILLCFIFAVVLVLPLLLWKDKDNKGKAQQAAERAQTSAMSVSRAALIALAAVLWATTHAATYSCVGADGKKSFSDRPCPPTATAVSRRDAGDRGYLAPRYGLTFGVQALPDDAVAANCQAAPAPSDRPREGGCDAQRGDTACTRALPVLCFKPAERRARASVVFDARSGRITMPPAAGGGPQLGASPALRGESLASQQSGTQACEQALGAGWRMASLQDSPSWGPQAPRDDSLANASGRFWVATSDQPANCWNAAPTATSGQGAAEAVPVEEKQIVADLLKFRSSPDYARLPPKCQQSYDRLERSLRQNKDSALVGAGALASLMEWLQECGVAPAR